MIDTSREAYIKVLPKLPSVEQMVIRYLREHGPATSDAI